MRLKNRLSKLEANHQLLEGDYVDLIQLAFLSADPDEHIDNELYRIQGGGGEWLRNDGEPEDVFIERALAAAKALKPGIRVVCLGIPERA